MLPIRQQTPNGKDSYVKHPLPDREYGDTQGTFAEMCDVCKCIVIQRSRVIMTQSGTDNRTGDPFADKSSCGIISEKMGAAPLSLFQPDGCRIIYLGSDKKNASITNLMG